ncbi:hypothetical protein FFE93_012340 [Yersinia sp. KBS0713]|uniref:C39 family peptidase n=1 Tax=Yersinia TaxID=629 RepID=UPI00110E1EAD|nr:MULTISPECIES: C39 family peptidase [Yersinia]QDW33774.1 hypothetical protein FFE93_012340 [Yersinia sp. KBS0713]
MEDTIDLSARPPEKFKIDEFEKYFEMQKQSQWCWIATAVAVGNFYESYTVRPNDKTTKWDQIDTYKKLKSTCHTVTTATPLMSLGTKDLCNETGNPQTSLQHVFCFVNKYANSTIELPEIKRIIATGKPVIVGLKKMKQDGTLSYQGHVITLYGYDGPNTWYVGDPLEGIKTLLLNKVTAANLAASEFFITKKPG